MLPAPRMLGACTNHLRRRNVSCVDLQWRRIGVYDGDSLPGRTARVALAAGTDLKTISNALGHSAISVTANTYLHVGESPRRCSTWRTRRGCSDGLGPATGPHEGHVHEKTAQSRGFDGSANGNRTRPRGVMMGRSRPVFHGKVPGPARMGQGRSPRMVTVWSPSYGERLSYGAKTRARSRHGGDATRAE